MENDVARFVFTHEPFDVAFGGEVTGCKSGQMTEAQFLDFNRKWLDAALPYVVDGGVLGTFIHWRGLPIVHASATRGNFSLNTIKTHGSDEAGAGQREAGNISACESQSNISTANAATPEASDRSLRRGKKKTAITHALAIKASATMPNLCLLGFSLYAPYGDLFP